MMDTMDRYQQQAIDMILGGQAREAFDLDKEDPQRGRPLRPADRGAATR